MADDNRSRFDRRRILKVGAAGAGILATVRSPVTWGCGLGNAGALGSVTVLLSANASNPENVSLMEPLAPCDWLRVMTSNESSHLKICSMLESKGCGPSARLIEKILPKQLYRVGDWLCKSESFSSDASFLDILRNAHNGNFEIKVECTAKSSKKYGSRENVIIDIAEGINDAAAICVAAYCNAALYPDLINYYDMDAVDTNLRFTFDEALKGILDAKGRKTLNDPRADLKRLMRDLEKWQHV